MDSSTEQRLLESLRELTFSQNWDDVRHSLRRHPELLSPESIELFGWVIDELEQRGELRNAQTFRRYYDILVRTRHAGIEEAIAEARGDTEGISAELRAILEQVSGPEPAPEDVPERIQLLEQALELTSRETTPEVWASVQGMLGDSLMATTAGDRGANVDRALSAYRETSSLLSKASQPIVWAITSNNLAKAHLERLHGDAEENRGRAVEAFRASLGVFTGELGPRVLTSETEDGLLELSRGSREDLGLAIDRWKSVLLVFDGVGSAAEGVVDIPRLELLLRHQVGLETQDVGAPSDEATPESTRTDLDGRDVQRSTNEDAWNLAIGGAKLLTEYWATDRLDTLLEALQLLESAASSITAASPDRPDVLDLLGKALRAYHERTRARGVLERAIVAHREAVALTARDSPSRAHLLIDLSEDLHERHRETGEETDLEEALELAREAAELVPDNSDERPTFLRILGEHYRARYSSRGEPSDLEAGIDAFREALALVSPDSASRFEVLTGLSATLVVRYGRAGDIADLDEAIRLAREAVELAPAMSNDRAVISYGLGRSLARRYAHSGEIADLDEAIESYRQALALTPPNSPDRVELLGGLGAALNSRYERTGDGSELDESIDLWGRAAELVPAASPDRPGALNRLSVGLRDRYFRTGDLADLERAMDLSRQTVALTPETSPSRPMYLVGLGTGLRERYVRRPNLADIDEANALWREALESTPASDPDRPEILRSLAAGLYSRYRHTGDISDLHQSIERSREALDLTPRSSPDRSGYLNNLAGGLVERFEQEGDAADLENAITIWREALDPGRARESADVAVAGNLAIALGKRYDRAGEPGDLDEAKSLFHQAVSAGLAGRLGSGLTSSLVWGAWAFERRSWEEAGEAFGYGLQAMEELFRTQLTRPRKEIWLREAQGLPAQAAYALAQAGDVEGAVLALERGRALLLSEALQRDRVGLEQLAEIGHGDLVERYRRTAERLALLERSALASEEGLPNPPLRERPAEPADQAAVLRSARVELDAVIASIREVDGYARFLDPPDFADVRAAASTPLVYLAATEPGGIALVVAGDSVSALWLPQLTDRSVRVHVQAYLEAHGRRRERPAAWTEVLDETTGWLWDVAMGPLLEALVPAVRATLVPGGLLALLPLHAAWHADAEAPSHRRYALDELLLTFAPNGRALAAAAERSREAAADGLLAVDDPRPVAAGPLPAAGREVEAALAHFARARRIGGDDATLDAVLAAVGDYSVLHFACHGFANLAEPLASALLLAADEPLSLRELLTRVSLDARLAVLSACETAVPGAVLPDEVVNLPSGFLQAGVAGVVGSLWSVSDASTMALMARFYELWRVEGFEPAEALRRAQQWVRDASNGDKRDRFPEIEELGGRRVPLKARRLWEQAHAHRSPSYWAAFAYVGA